MYSTAPKRWAYQRQLFDDDVLEQVKTGVEWGLECWSEVMKEAINMALKS